MTTGFSVLGSIAAIVAALIAVFRYIILPLIKPQAYADLIEPERVLPKGELSIPSNEDKKITIRWRPEYFSQRVERITAGFVGEQGNSGQAHMVEFYDSLAEERIVNGEPWKVNHSNNNNLQKEYQGGRVSHAPKSLTDGLRKLLSFRQSYKQFKENNLRGDGLHIGVIVRLPHDNQVHTLFVEIDTKYGSHRTEFSLTAIDETNG